MEVIIRPNLDSAALLAVRLIAKELEFVGTFRFHREFAWAVDAIQSARINLEPLLTAQFAFRDVRTAFELAGDRQRAMKVSLRLE